MAGMMIQQGVYTKEQRELIQPHLNLGTVPGAFEQDLFQMHLGFASYTCEAQHSELLNRLGFWCDTDPKRPIYLCGGLTAAQVREVMDSISTHDAANVEIYSQGTKTLRYRRSPSPESYGFFHAWIQQYLNSTKA